MTKSEYGVLRAHPTLEAIEVSVELPVTQHTLVLREVQSRVAGGGHSSCAAQEGFQCADSSESRGLDGAEGTENHGSVSVAVQ